MFANAFVASAFDAEGQRIPAPASAELEADAHYWIQRGGSAAQDVDPSDAQRRVSITINAVPNASSTSVSTAFSKSLREYEDGQHFFLDELESAEQAGVPGAASCRLCDTAAAAHVASATSQVASSVQWTLFSTSSVEGGASAR